MRCEVSTFPPATAAGGERVDDRAGGSDHANRSHQAGRGRDLLVEQASENVEDGGLRDGRDGVDAAGALRRASREIDFRIFSRECGSSRRCAAGRL